MNIFIIKFFVNDRWWYSGIQFDTEKEATSCASEACLRWNDGTTFKIIEFTPVSNSDE